VAVLRLDLEELLLMGLRVSVFMVVGNGSKGGGDVIGGARRSRCRNGS